MRHYPCTPGTRDRKGIVLLAVLVVLVMLTLAAYQYSELMTAENRASESYARSAQAKALADSGIQFALAALGNSDALANTLQNNPYSNPAAFQNVVVRADDNPYFQGRFSLIALPDPDLAVSGGQTTYNFGVTDEAAKINLNTLLQIDSSGQVAHDMLLKLPNMTEDVADAIIDWIDADDQPRPSGAESDYYTGLTPPYHTKNGPLDTLEELLLVRGVTPQLLLGNDRNRNGQYDSEEADGSGALNPGWAAYLTVNSRDQNLDSDGNQRIYVNDSNLTTLYQNLQSKVGNALAVYILAYRIYGPAPSGAGPPSPGAAPLTVAALGNLASPRGNPRSISSLFELINTSVSISGMGSNAQPTIYASPLNDKGAQRQLLPQLLDRVSTRKDLVLPGRININTASQTVLAALPGLTDTDVQTILQTRPAITDLGSADTIYQTPAWLIVQANLTPAKMSGLDSYITARSRVYRVQSVGYFDKGGPTVRVEAVIDANGPRPRIVYWRDLTELGKGFNLTGTGIKQP